MRLTIYSLALIGFFVLTAQPQFNGNAFATAQATGNSSVDELQKLFQSPPDDARIMMRWWWFGPSITKARLEQEMRLMRAGGIGGFEVQPVYPLALDDDGRGIKTLPYLSDDFLDALQFTAVKARELGLRFDLTLGSGWPFGGSTVSVNDAAGRLRVERVKVNDQSRRVKIPDVGNGEKLIAAFFTANQSQTFTKDSFKELTELKDGAVWLPENFIGAGEIFFFISSRTGQQVKRPALGGEGFVLSHLDRAATENYLKTVGDRLFAKLESHRPYAIFCDSLEVYNSDWTPDLLEEFQKRRGYDLKPHLPALVVSTGEHTADIRRDWGRTLSELFNERFLIPLHDWAKRQQTRLRVQSYGVPAVRLSSNAHLDLSEGEGVQWRGLSTTRWASSASHIYDRKVTSSEIWTWLHSPSFRATPLDVKAEADRHFLQGINQLIGHGWPYTPEGIAYPGWRFYAAGVFNEKNPWWVVMPEVSSYLQRLSFLMRQGRPANDVAIYLPNDDAWSRFSNGKIHLVEVLREMLGQNLIPSVLGAGFNFDFFDDDSFKQIGRVENGSLVLGEQKYRAVILPNVENIPLDTLEKLQALARGGGVLIATRQMPVKAPGMHAAADKPKVTTLSQAIFSGASPIGHFVTDETEQLKNRLASLVKPDVQLSPQTSDIGFIHRQTESAEIYFLANTGNVSRNVKATFRVQGMNAEWWNPFDGTIAPAKIESQSAQGTTLTLELEPYGSRVLVFTKRALPVAQIKPSQNIPTAMDISNEWQVTFGENQSAVRFATLRSWTDDESTRYFSGLASYEKTINVPDSFLQSGLNVQLDFGEGMAIASQPARPQAGPGMQTYYDAPVREAAVIYLNNQKAGTLWCPPYKLDVTKFIRRGENQIKIVVANTAINHMAGRALPDYRLLNSRYGERFQPQDMDRVQPVPSGILQPIRLVPTAKL
ncbi:MAG: glycosyl hydrolase [Acidobacteriota bacterium]